MIKKMIIKRFSFWFGITVLFYNDSSTASVVTTENHALVMLRKCNTTISSHFEDEGTVTSPGYPHFYKHGTSCSFTFLGTAEERVQLTFTHFLLPEPSADIRDHERCLHTDYVAVYNINNNTIRREIDHFCGSTVPPPIMSAQSGLHMVFRSISNYSEGGVSQPVFGFSVTFKFLKNFGLECGDQPTPGVCNIIYNSSRASNGTIHAPNPGGFYPQDTTCKYFFYGKPGEIVRLIFKYFDVEGILPCDAASDSDYLEFSNFPIADRKLPPYCGGFSPAVLQSDGAFFRVTFKSNDKFDGTGFAADYQFLDISHQPYTIRRIIVAAGGSGDP